MTLIHTPLVEISSRLNQWNKLVMTPRTSLTDFSGDVRHPTDGTNQIITRAAPRPLNQLIQIKNRLSCLADVLPLVWKR